MRGFFLFSIVLAFAAFAAPASAQNEVEATSLIDEAMRAAEPILARNGDDMLVARISLLVNAGRCGEAEALLVNDGPRGGIVAGVAALWAGEVGDWPCAARFARLMHRRRDVSDLTVPGVYMTTHRAGSILRRAGEEAEGRLLVRQAEEELAALGSSGSRWAGEASNTLWRERLQAIFLFDGTPLFAPEFDAAVRELVGLNWQDIDQTTRNGFIFLLVREGRQAEAQIVMDAGSDDLGGIESIERGASSYRRRPLCPVRAEDQVSRGDIATALEARIDEVRLINLSAVVRKAAVIRRCAAGA